MAAYSELELLYTCYCLLNQANYSNIEYSSLAEFNKSLSLICVEQIYKYIGSEEQNEYTECFFNSTWSNQPETDGSASLLTVLKDPLNEKRDTKSLELSYFVIFLTAFYLLTIFVSVVGK